MKEKKKARMRDGTCRKLKTVYFYDGWYAVKDGVLVHYCGDSEYIKDGGNLNNVPSDDVFTLGQGCVNCMQALVELIKEHNHEN